VGGLIGRSGELPVEGQFPSLGGATDWLNSAPLDPEGLRGKVVVVNFCTYTCINWLRSLPYVRAWAETYERHGLITIGVHTPEFSFEHDLENVRRALKAMEVTYPIAIDNDYAVWNATSTWGAEVSRARWWAPWPTTSRVGSSTSGTRVRVGARCGCAFLRRPRRTQTQRE
jgi:thiol-disulfide isomerase/thioredoxin